MAGKQTRPEGLVTAARQAAARGLTWRPVRRCATAHCLPGCC